MRRFFCIALLLAACAAKDGDAPVAEGPKRLFLDVHELRNLSVAEIEAAHTAAADFEATWVDAKEGRVYSLVSAPSAAAVARAHAHGLVPRSVLELEEPRKALVSALK